MTLELYKKEKSEYIFTTRIPHSLKKRIMGIAKKKGVTKSFFARVAMEELCNVEEEHITDELAESIKKENQ